MNHGSFGLTWIREMLSKISMLDHKVADCGEKHFCSWPMVYDFKWTDLLSAFLSSMMLVPQCNV